MKPTRSLLLALSALLLAAGPVLRAADETRPPGPPPGERGERMAERMAEELGLTAEQQAKMKEIGAQERAEMQALRGDTSLSKEDRRTKGEVIHEKYKAQRDAILTPEQRVKADKMRGKMKDRMEKQKERREKAGQ